MVRILKLATFPFHVVRILAGAIRHAIASARREEEVASKFRAVFGETGDGE